MKFEKESFLRFTYVHGPVFSSDGNYVAYGTKKPNLKKNGYDSTVVVAEVKDPKHILHVHSTTVGNYVWDDLGLLMTDCRGEQVKEETVFYRLSLSGGESKEAFRIAHRVQNIEYICDGKYLVTVLEGKQENPEHYHELDSWPFWFNGAGFVSGTSTSVYLFDRNTKELTKVNEEPVEVHKAVYHNDTVYYVGAVSETMKMKNAGIYEGQKEIVPADCRVEDLLVKDENHLWILSQKDDVASTEVYELDLHTYTRKFIGSLHGDVSSTVGSDAKMGGGISAKMYEGKLYYVYTTNETSVLMTMDETGKTETVCETDGAIYQFDVCEGHLAVCAMRSLGLCEIYLDGKPITSCSEVLKEYTLSTPEYFEYTGNDGVCIHGYVMKPVGYTEGTKYPGILHIHGGPRTVFGSVLHAEMQLWANEGYFVMYCNPRGSDGRGEEFADIYGKYGTVEYDNLMEFTDECIRRYPDIDVNRLGVGGGSYGGFMTNWIIGHTSRFQAAVSQRSIANWITFEHTSDIGVRFSVSQHTTTTEEDVEKLWWHSPVKYADKVTTPTLFIHSDADYRCYMVEGLAMLTALKMHGVPSKMALFHNESHELSRSGKPKNRIQRMEEIVKWYDTYLKEEN